MGKQKVILEFTRRSRSYLQEAMKLITPVSSTALRDIGGNRRAASSNLARQAEKLVLRKCCSRFIRSQSQLMRLLPNLKLPEIPHTFAG